MNKNAIKAKTKTISDGRIIEENWEVGTDVNKDNFMEQANKIVSSFNDRQPTSDWHRELVSAEFIETKQEFEDHDIVKVKLLTKDFIDAEGIAEAIELAYEDQFELDIDEDCLAPLKEEGSDDDPFIVEFTCEYPLVNELKNEDYTIHSVELAEVDCD